MIKFFKKLRFKTLKKDGISKYLLYAFGEIVLVVIGILIALAINDWNTKRTDQKNISEYYKKILVEIDDNIKYFDNLLDNRKAYKRDAIRALNILNEKNTDSLPELIKNVSSLRNINSINMSFPIIDEFLSQNNLSKIENDNIKSLFIEYSEMVKFTNLVDAYSIEQYQIRIEPFFLSNINHSKMPLDGFEEIAIIGGPSSNVDNLWNNLELWNLLYVKVETWEFENNSLRWGKDLLEELKLNIKKDLSKK